MNSYYDWYQNMYSGTPLNDHPWLAATRLLRPLTLGPERISIHHNASETPDLRPPVYSV